MSGAAVRSQVVRLIELVGVCGFAIAQPILATFGDTPEQFTFRGATTTDIILFALFVLLVPAVVLWLPGVLVRLFSARASRGAQVVAIGLALFVGLLQLVHHIFGVSGIAKAALAGAGALAGAVLYRRHDAARLWARVMAAASLVFVGLFLFASPAGDLAFADPPEPVEIERVPATADVTEADSVAPGLPDVVMIILDELPTRLLLTPEGEIDAVRYPALAGFGADATWYRRHTTVSAQTTAAVPAIVSGRLTTEPGGAAWTQHPDTLFRLLAGSYHLTVSEGFTKLCPEDWCGTSPVPPPAPSPTPTPSPPPTSAVAEQPPAEVTSTDPATNEPDRGGLRRLLDDAVDLWRDQIALDRDDAPVFSGFEETAVETLPASTTTTAAPTATLPGDLVELPDVDGEVTRDRFAGLNAQLPRIEAFRAAIRPSDEPTLYYLHIVLPHQPFIFTENGDQYDGPSAVDAQASTWDDELLATRMSLQMQFADGIVGGVLDDLRAADLYDDSLVVVMADHGASLDTASTYRYYDGTNAPDLMVTPLLVKAPGQSTGVVSDAGIEVIDVLPTMAEIMGIEVPWEMDGHSVGSPPTAADAAGCDDVRHYVRFGLDVLGDDSGIEQFELCGNEVVPAGLVPVLGEISADDWGVADLARATPYAELLGASWESLGAEQGSATATLDDGAAVRGSASPPIGVIRGTVESGVGAAWVAVAVDGRIAGISPVHTRRGVDELVVTGDDEHDRFTVIVPSALLSAAGYDVRVAALQTVDDLTVATELPVDP